MATSIIKKAAKAAVKELGEDVRIDRRNMFRFPQKDQPLMEIPKGAPTVTEKTLEVAPEGVKGEKVTKSVIDTPVSRRTVVKSAGSQLAQNVVPKVAPTPQLTAQELFGSAKSMPDLYASMLPLVRKVAPEELASMADRLGFTIDDIIAMSGQDLLPSGDLTMEGLTRFEELFPITASRVVKKAGGGIIKKAAQAAAKPAPKEQKMLMGVYRGYTGENAAPLVHYHGGTYEPGDLVRRPLYVTRDPEMAQSYAEEKGGRLVPLDPRPRRTAPQGTLEKLAARHVPENRELGYTPASALDTDLHGERAVGRLQYELGRNPYFYDSVRAADVGFGGEQGEVLVMLPGSEVRPVGGDPLFATPQRGVAEFYAQKRAAQTGEEPHVEMLLVDPFAGRQYGHSIPGGKGKPPMVTKARQLKPEDVKSTTRLYAEGGPVAGAQFNGMVSNAMKNGMGEAEALRQLLPLFR